jgi:hypothetical protein
MSTAPAPIAQYRPPQWAKMPMVSVTVPASYGQSSVGTEVSGSSPDTPLQLSVTSSTTYVFDAVLSLEHGQTLTKTMHPVQNGAAITSHAYLNPASLVIYVLMSDVTPQYVASNQTSPPYVQQWTGNSSKSVSAYQQMLALQASRVPLQVTTRLRTYSNMLIADISPHEDNKSITGARFRVEFSQLFLADVQTAPTSSRPNETNQTGLGEVSTAPTTSTIDSQFLVPPGSMINTLNADSINNQFPAMPGTLIGSAQQNQTAVNVPGAGSYSSTPQQFGGSN